MNSKRYPHGRLIWAGGVAIVMAIGVSQLQADGSGQSFMNLSAGFTQELFGASADLSDPEFGILGGVAFAPNGDVWSSECVFSGTRLHRFHLDQTMNQYGTDIHPETIVEAPETAGGCGLTNHPDGAIYSNSEFGIFRLSADTGEALAGPLGRPGNGLGIAVDPQADPDGSHHLAYVGADCHPSLNLDPDHPSTMCTIWDLNPATGDVAVFARLTRSEFEFFDGIYFDPGGAYLFGARRASTIDPDSGDIIENNSLRIIRRPAVLGDPDTAPVDNAQIVQDVALTSEPDGVAFHATDGFVVTLNESDDGPGAGGTMTRFDFGGNFEAPPAQTVFASGGFRGDLLQVGGDGCVYATQGTLFESGGTSGVRYNEGTETPENSIVKICGGFAVPPGVPGAGVIGDFVWNDLNQNGLQDSMEPGLANVPVMLTSSEGTATTLTDGSGFYQFTTLKAGITYTVTVATPSQMVLSPSGMGSDSAVDSNGTSDGDGNAGAQVSLATNTSKDLTIDFGFYGAPAKVSGFTYVDTNLTNGVKDPAEAILSNVVVSLTRSSSGPPYTASQNTGVDGRYEFSSLMPGDYDISAEDPASGKKLHTSLSLHVTLVAAEDRTDQNFGYVPGSIAGFAYADTSGNGIKDPGEAGIGGVMISLGGASTGTALTQSDGSYVFSALNAGDYSVSAPATAGSLTLSTSSSIGVGLAAGENRPNVNFGYVAPVVPATVQCSKATVQGVLDPATGRYPGNHGPDQIVRFDLNQSVQGAINDISDSNNDGYLIILVLQDGTGALGGDRTESIEISQSYSKPFGLFGCSATLHDANRSDGKPTARITTSAGSAGTPGNIYVMDLHAADSEVEGWRVEGNGRYLRNVEARGNAVGIRFVGNSNMMHNGAVENNLGIGLAVQGNSNIVTDTDAFSNSGHGVQVIGNTNQVLKVDSGDKNKGNGGDGVHVEGAGNLLQENDAFANVGDGIELVATSGSPNVIKKSRSGDKSGLANAGNGILVAGPGNGTASPIELEENTVKANGLVGIRITGTGHQLKNNVSGGSASGETNVGCEFNVVSGNVNATGNKANGTTVAGPNGSAFIIGCVGSN